jgi:hypothetical protein
MIQAPAHNSLQIIGSTGQAGAGSTKVLFSRKKLTIQDFPKLISDVFSAGSTTGSGRKAKTF